MKITALAPWFGSKRTLAPRIVAELGEHSAYWEPFCGSMAVLLVKPESSHEHVNDLHGDLINLARVIQDPHDGPILYRSLRRVLFCEPFHDEAKQRLVADHYDSRIDRAHDYFVMSWMGRNGVSGTCSFNQTLARRWTRNGGQGGLRFSNAVQSIPAFRRRLRRVTIHNEDGFGIIEKIEDQEGVAIYVDPPYLIKGARYQHDFELPDHRRLATSLHRFKLVRVVVSYYDHPLLAELYPDFTRVDCSIPKALVNVGMRNKAGGPTIAPEVLLINGPSYTATKGELLFAE